VKPANKVKPKNDFWDPPKATNNPTTVNNTKPNILSMNKPMQLNNNLNNKPVVSGLPS
jgi:hypothetical protein